MDEHRFQLLIFLSVITHCIRTAYEILKHKKVIRAGRLSFLIIFTDMIVLWASWFMLGVMGGKQGYLPPAVSFIGAALIGGGVIIFLTALFTIKTLETFEGELITRGVYSFFRHPMYLGFILWLFGVPLFYGSYTLFLLAVPFSANVLYWRYLEELELMKRFPEYRNYRKNTWF